MRYVLPVTGNGNPLPVTSN
ncbi:unnamed protein product, partial [Didymodactylos carnosus]